MVREATRDFIATFLGTHAQRNRGVPSLCERYALPAVKSTRRAYSGRFRRTTKKGADLGVPAPGNCLLGRTSLTLGQVYAYTPGKSTRGRLFGKVQAIVEGAVAR